MKSFRNKLKSKKDDGNALPYRAESGAPAVGGAESPAASMAGEGVVNETPEAAAARLVRTFCMSDVNDAGAEVALLPSIVEAAESSPQAATECARYIRKFMHRDYWARPNYVYNAIMLMRILVENPGLTFTRNMDKKFVDAVKDVLRGCEHAHVVHFLIEAMQELESKNAADEGIGRMIEMWRKEKTKSKSIYAQPPSQQVQQSRSGFWQRPQPTWQPQPQQMPMQQQPSAPPMMTRTERRHGSSATLPKPRELRRRLDEAKTTAGVLADIVNTTTPSGLLKHDLADDLVARCRRAASQVLEYLDTKDPFPDNQEMAALLSTHEVLQQTLRHYYGAVLEARKAVNIGETRRAEDGSIPVEMTPAGKGKANAPLSPVAAGASASASNGHSNGHDSPRDRHNDDDDINFGRNEDDDMIAAAIAASVAPGANARPGRAGYGQQYEGGGPANDSDNPFADNIHAESSRSSSHARPSYGGGGSSSAAAGGAGSSLAAGPVAYVNSDDDSDEEYLRHRRRNKGVAEGSSSAVGEGSAYAGSSSQKAPATGPAELYAPPSGPPPPRPAATGSSAHGAAELGGPSAAGASGSGPAVDAASGGQFPVYRY
ncbi:gat domain-containing protein [Ophiostoma piceae UAMH 11346]|uniref:Gat domain-containing protein n=1 Tax=Ophiostoma piceae (strain UAMH 11346) TaxID=1262450 RepID=S3BYP6_OPHP1|nr:gat domain-containing protein [Ophiostoma piceae UAMH 11346]